MSRRVFFATCLSAIVAASLVMQVEKVHSQTRPNFVVIMADDLDVNTFQAAISKGLMPHTKSQLVDVGLTFSNSFVTSTQAATTRATFLTGQYPHNHGVRGSNPPLGGVTRLNANSTIATWLRASGYYTGYVGRYLLGYGVYTAETYIPPGWDSWAATIDPSTYTTDDYRWNYQGAMIDADMFTSVFGAPVHQTDATNVFTSVFLSGVSPTRPFFLSVNPYVPNYEIPAVNECPSPIPSYWGGNIWGISARPAARHLNSVYGNLQDFALPQGPSFNEADVADKPLWLQEEPALTPEDIDCLQRAYWRRLETLRALDDLVGAVIGKLQASGTLSNTYIILTSDNGFVNGEHRLTQKGSAHEPAIRVPLVIRVPRSTAGMQLSALVINNDLAPTMAHLAGATPTLAVDGRSLVPILTNPTTTAPWRSMVLVEHFEQIVIENFSYPPPYSALRTVGVTPRLFARYGATVPVSSPELYDLALDPFELENLAGHPARQAEVAVLQLWLNAMDTCVGVNCRLFEQYFYLPN